MNYLQLPINNTGKTLESLEQDQNTQQTGELFVWMCFYLFCLFTSFQYFICI
jgi:hypothetical protein